MMTLLISSLAVFRLALLLSEDGGPYKMFSKLRGAVRKEAKHNKTLAKSDVQHGISCLRCSSVGVAAPVAAFHYFRMQLVPWVATVGDGFLLWMALSAAAILWNRAFPAK